MTDYDKAILLTLGWSWCLFIMNCINTFQNKLEERLSL